MQAGIKHEIIGRFERFSEDVRVLVERIAPEFIACLPQEHHYATAATGEIATYLTANLQDLIYRKLRQDFEFFGYSILA